MEDAPLPTRQNAVCVSDDHVSTIPLSWADIQEQADALRTDLEASVMGNIPPVPDEWIFPKKVARRNEKFHALTGHVETLEKRNAFNCLAEEGLRRWAEDRCDLPCALPAAPHRAPSASSRGSHPSSGPSSAPSRSLQA